MASMARVRRGRSFWRIHFPLWFYLLWTVGVCIGQARVPGPVDFDNPDMDCWSNLDEDDFFDCGDGTSGGGWEAPGDGNSNLRFDSEPTLWYNRVPFASSKEFVGARCGYVFKCGHLGQGYYTDVGPAALAAFHHTDNGPVSVSSAWYDDEALRVGTFSDPASAFAAGLDYWSGTRMHQCSSVHDCGIASHGSEDTPFNASSLTFDWPDYVKKHDASSLTDNHSATALNPNILEYRQSERTSLPLWELLFGAMSDDLNRFGHHAETHTRRRKKRQRPKRSKNKSSVLHKATSINKGVSCPSHVFACSDWHEVNCLEAVDTVNPNSLKGIHKYMGASSALVIMAQESRVADSDAIEAGERAAARLGWNLAITPAQVTIAGGVSAGVAIATRTHVGMSRRNLSFIPEPYRHRITCTHVGALCRGGTHFVSIYPWHSEGLSSRNLDLMHYAAQVVKGLVGPWIMGADWNLSPQVLKESGWLELVRGTIVQPNGPTCGHNTYDFFVVSEGLASSIIGAAIVQDAGLYPHSPVRLFVKRGLRRPMKRVLVHPLKYQACLPRGCLDDPEKHGLEVAIQSGDIDILASCTINAIETELGSLAGLDACDSAKHGGRADGPKFAMRPAIGPVATLNSKCSVVTAAWDTLASWLSLVLVHWGAGKGGRGHLATLFNAKKKIVHHTWNGLGDSGNARILIEWAARVSACNLEDKVLVYLIHKSTRAIAKCAHEHDEHASRIAWRNWLHEGPAKGLGRQHKLSRTSCGWVPSSIGPASDQTCEDDNSIELVDDVEGLTEADVSRAGVTDVQPLNKQQEVEAEALKWGEIWQVGVPGIGPRWPDQMGPSMPVPSVSELREACFTFPIEVGLGWDKLHPRAIARCSDTVLQAIIALFLLAESTGKWFQAIGVIMVVLIPKSDGGKRPIGLFPSLIRLWMRVRLKVAQQWVRDNERPYFYAGPCKGADVASWKQALLAEASKAMTLPYIASLLDLIKAFDSVPFDHLSAEAARARYNLFLLRLSIASYLLARVIEVGGCCSEQLLASCGLAAGSILATIELRVLLLSACDRLVASSLYCRITLYVDDATLETVCASRTIVQKHTDAVNAFVADLQSIRLQFSDTKNVTIASTMLLARAANSKLVGLAIKAVSRVVSLGTGLGAGTRRNVKQVQKRLRAFILRRSRFKMLRSSGVQVDRLLRTGGNAAMLYGQKPLGVSNSTLLAQRRAASAASRVRGCGADLDLSLMLADANSKGAADPAFEAHVGVLQYWAMAVWERWAPLAMLEFVVKDAKRRLQEALAKDRSPWSLVFGPAAALVATADRLKWSVSSAFQVITDLGVVVDFKLDSPAMIKGLVIDAVSRWRWRRLEDKYPALDSGGLGTGAAWRPISKALNMKATGTWTNEHKAALKSAVSGRQWSQQRKHKANLVTSNLCQLCLDLPGGNQCGTLLHRWVCPALAPFRQEHMPKHIADYLRLNGRAPNGALILALTRGLFRNAPPPQRDDALFDTFRWIHAPFNVPPGSTVFSDGSLQDNTLPREYHSLGWAFVVIAPNGHICAAACGVPPKWVNTIQGAELWAVQMALQSVQFPGCIYTDCDSVRLGTRQPLEWAGSSKRRYARIWQVIASHIEDQYETVQWMPAHISCSSIGQKVCSDGRLVDHEMWLANDTVDQLAKGAAETCRVPFSQRHWFICREKQLLDLVVFVGKLTNAANSFALPDGTIIRDSEDCPLRRPKHQRRKARTGKDPSTRSPLSSADAPERNTQQEWLSAWLRDTVSRAPSGGRPPHSHVSSARVQARITERQEEAFQDWWRESRSQSLTPRDPALPTASKKMADLRRRLASRGINT